MSRISRKKFRSVENLYDSEDHEEGFRAFAEKRDPKWKGKIKEQKTLQFSLQSATIRIKVS